MTADPHILAGLATMLMSQGFRGSFASEPRVDQNDLYYTSAFHSSLYLCLKIHENSHEETLMISPP